jgi:hypothetical protein
MFEMCSPVEYSLTILWRRTPGHTWKLGPFQRPTCFGPSPTRILSWTANRLPNLLVQRAGLFPLLQEKELERYFKQTTIFLHLNFFLCERKRNEKNRKNRRKKCHTIPFLHHQRSQGKLMHFLINIDLFRHILVVDTSIPSDPY